MLTAAKIKLWYRVHKWTSLICTAFLLMLCVTGLPLIFYHEIEHLAGDHVEPPAMAADAPRASLDAVAATALASHPGSAIQFLFWEADEPDLVFAALGDSASSPPEENRFATIDARTAALLATPVFNTGVMHFIYTLHVEAFAGLPGMLFLGAMGLLFVVAILSGAVLYGPFMRKLDFGAVRKTRSPRVKWLDLHNLLGIVTLTWALVVGATGAINTLSELVFQAWQNDQLAAMTAPYKSKTPPATLASLDRAMQAARSAAPGMAPDFVAFPGNPFASNHHYAVFMRGTEPFNSRLLKPALVDAETGELTDWRDLPWYVTALLVSQPLHFGDYGGLPLKILWALFDAATIVVLGSGLYLWLRRRKTPIEERLDELARDQAPVRSAA